MKTLRHPNVLVYLDGVEVNSIDSNEFHVLHVHSHLVGQSGVRRDGEGRSIRFVFKRFEIQQ